MGSDGGVPGLSVLRISAMTRNFWPSAVKFGIGCRILRVGSHVITKQQCKLFSPTARLSHMNMYTPGSQNFAEVSLC
jgi:hypothetical protein